MNIQHIHLDSTSSTQSILKDHIKKNHASGHVLISTDHQTDGVGRRGNSWDHYSEALAFSFTLTPTKNLTLTPLELGIHLSRFFSPYVKLKWPNDLLNRSKEKVGGILCQLLDNIIVVGIGINLVNQKNSSSSYPYPIGGIFNHFDRDTSFRKDIPLKIYEAILKNRLNNEEVIKEWEENCCHLNAQVTIEDNKNSTVGTFKGIDKNGEALIITKDNCEKSILSGSLRF